MAAPYVAGVERARVDARPDMVGACDIAAGAAVIGEVVLERSEVERAARAEDRGDRVVASPPPESR